MFMSDQDTDSGFFVCLIAYPACRQRSACIQQALSRLCVFGRTRIQADLCRSPRRGKLMYYIYALIDPRDNLIHYVGLTGNVPTRRIADHLTDTTGAKAEWLTDLLDAAFMPTFVVLQKADDLEQAHLRESWWISTGEMFGWPLTNVAKTAKQKRSTLEHAHPEVKKVVVKEIKETNEERALVSKWNEVAKAWFDANPQALTGPAKGISDLARAMCRDNEGGSDANYEAYKGRAFTLFHDFRKWGAA